MDQPDRSNSPVLRSASRNPLILLAYAATTLPPFMPIAKQAGTAQPFRGFVP